MNKLKYRVQYRPAELMIMNELKNSTTKDEKTVEDLKKGYSKAKYFLLEIGYDERNQEENGEFIIKNAITYQQYEQRVKQLAFSMKQYVSLEVDGETYEPSMYHFERGYELAKKTTLLFAFDVENPLGEMTFVVNDQLFDTGINRFKFQDINREIPAIPLMN